MKLVLALAVVLRVTVLLAFCAAPAAAQNQNQPYSAPDDPVIRASAEAQRDSRYADAEKILADAIPSAEKTAPNPRLALYLGQLADLLERKGDSARALDLGRRALQTEESLYGTSDIRLAPGLTFFAHMLSAHGKREEAELLYQRAVNLVRQAPNPDILPADARSGVLSSVASHYQADRRLPEATLLYEEAVKTCAGVRWGPLCDHARQGLADLYRSQGRSAEAAPPSPTRPPAELMELIRKAQEDFGNRLYVQAELGHRNAIQWIESHPKANVQGLLAGEWMFLGRDLEAQGRIDQSEDAYRKSLVEELDHVNPKIPNSMDSFIALSPLTNLYRRQGRIREMEPLIEHALAVQEKAVGPEHAYVAQTLLQLARVYEEEAKADPARYSAAISIYERALKIQVKNDGPDSQRLILVLTDFAKVLRLAHQDARAAELQSRLNALRRK